MKILIFLVLSFCCTPSFANTEYVLGTAKNRQGELKYTEHHTMTYKNNLLTRVETRYYNSDNQEFASLISEFSAHQFLPDSVFKDLRTHKSEITKVEGEKYVLSSIDEKGEKQSDSLDIEKNMLCGQGYHNYLRANLSTFKLNQKNEIKFVLPSRRDYYSFDLSLIKETDSVKTFRLAITNWILKMFADSIEVDYDKDGNLLAYRGLSNIQDLKGDNMDVTIELKKVEGFK